eukprot:CAMPEP_0169466526 /NCGR_PEP_ID=MMETSP1042-20121227/21822_1 /TAXON_ID=464988 /ORGANISM="Hemiselmis andersenii, Strain CCMP1180" /LENGTH=110 /DNA_ID=CAMNT_0009579599 /DNA_START=226 /DNA_END=555 /DNA_ORIENTATION=+
MWGRGLLLVLILAMLRGEQGLAEAPSLSPFLPRPSPHAAALRARSNLDQAGNGPGDDGAQRDAQPSGRREGYKNVREDRRGGAGGGSGALRPVSEGNTRMIEKLLLGGRL